MCHVMCQSFCVFSSFDLKTYWPYPCLIVSRQKFKLIFLFILFESGSKLVILLTVNDAVVHGTVLIVSNLHSQAFSSVPRDVLILECDFLLFYEFSSSDFRRQIVVRGNFLSLLLLHCYRNDDIPKALLDAA